MDGIAIAACALFRLDANAARLRGDRLNRPTDHKSDGCGKGEENTTFGARNRKEICGIKLKRVRGEDFCQISCLLEAVLGPKRKL